jgi:hypothetical protein
VNIEFPLNGIADDARQAYERGKHVFAAVALQDPDDAESLASITTTFQITDPVTLMRAVGKVVGNCQAVAWATIEAAKKINPQQALQLAEAFAGGVEESNDTSKAIVCDVKLTTMEGAASDQGKGQTSERRARADLLIFLRRLPDHRTRPHLASALKALLRRHRLKCLRILERGTQKKG